MRDVISLSEVREGRRLEAILADLPPADTKRWVVRRKAAVVAAVREAVLSEAEALKRYGLSAEELASWRESLEKHGVPALYATRVQLYRNRKDG